jgi:HK97 gp10 family phage protein
LSRPSSNKPVISIFGVDAAIAKMLGLAAATDLVAEEAARKAAEPIEAAAKERVPVDTGALKDSIHIESEVENGVADARVVAGGDSAPYAVFVEFAPDNEPFLRPAADDGKDEAVKTVEGIIATVIR